MAGPVGHGMSGLAGFGHRGTREQRLNGAAFPADVITPAPKVTSAPNPIQQKQLPPLRADADVNFPLCIYKYFSQQTIAKSRPHTSASAVTN